VHGGFRVRALIVKYDMILHSADLSFIANAQAKKTMCVSQ
jgi:hypothetical protein